MRLGIRLAGLLLSLLLAAVPLFAAEDWPPVTPADLQYTGTSGASAVILYAEDVSSAPTNMGGGRIDQNTVFTRRIYERIKVLTEEGKQYANIEIPYVKNFDRIEDLHARVVQPDGSIQDFNGQVFDKTVTKDRAGREQELTFTLPNVKAGSILEYRYAIRWNRYLLDTDWELQRELWVKKAHFSIQPYTGAANVALRLGWIGINLPASTQPANQGGVWSIDVADVPPIPRERYAPPEEWSHMTVRFIYSSDPDAGLSPDEFWQKKAKWWGDWAEKFVSKHKEVDAEVAKLISASDSPETKLRKLYARAQQVRNLSYAPAKSEKEMKQEDLKEPENADEVLKRGYASEYRINQFFVAMARAAGFDATYAVVAPRNKHVFFKNILNTKQFSNAMVVVKLNGQSLFLDPGIAYLPYGMLDWMHTDAPVLTTTPKGGEFLQTPAPRAEDAIIERKASLHIADAGLEGTMKVSYHGTEALGWRLDERNNDEAGKTKAAEDALRRLLPSGATIELTKAEGWTSTEEPLTFEYKVSIPNALTRTSKRLLVPAGLLQVNDVHPFEYTSRRLPVYFAFPSEEIEDISIDVPEGFAVEGVPPPLQQTSWLGGYARKTMVESKQLHLHRDFKVTQYMIMPEQYPSLRGFYSTVRGGDDQTLVLQAATH